MNASTFFLLQELIVHYLLRTIIEMLLESLPAMAAENQTVEAAIGGPARAAQIALVRSVHRFLVMSAYLL